MTVMVDREIKQAVAEGRITICPFDEAMVQPCSLDIKLGRNFKYYESSAEILDVRKPESLSRNVREVDGDCYILPPYEFVLARSLEIVSIPADVVAILEGKSSLARLGVTIHQTGGVIDPGFAGTITLEISNVNSRPVKLYFGMPIGQLVFHDIGAFVENPYHGKYQHQIDATVARY